MHGNGGDHYAHLAERVAAVEQAIALLARRWEAELVPRLLDVDRDLDELARALAELHRHRTLAAGAHPSVAPAVDESSSARGTDDGAASVPPVASVARSSPSVARERPAPPGREEEHDARL